MANAEKTKNTILEVAGRLFLEKGYEHTRISDIIDGLDGLTKGAIYHYFDSKEDIFNEVVKNIGMRNKVVFDAVKFSKDLTGSEKITKIISLSLDNENTEQIVSISPRLVDSPKLLASGFKQIQEVTIPEYFLPIIEEGIEDGSIQASDPKSLAELLAVLFNVWLNPLIFDYSSTVFHSKMEIMKQCLNNFNINIPI